MAQGSAQIWPAWRKGTLPTAHRFDAGWTWVAGRCALPRLPVACQTLWIQLLILTLSLLAVLLHHRNVGAPSIPGCHPCARVDAPRAPRHPLYPGHFRVQAPAASPSRCPKLHEPVAPVPEAISSLREPYHWQDDGHQGERSRGGNVKGGRGLHSCYLVRVALLCASLYELPCLDRAALACACLKAAITRRTQIVHVAGCSIEVAQERGASGVVVQDLY